MKTKCMMWHVSNAGVVLSTDERTQVGIDCFSRDKAKLYSDTPVDIREELWKEIEQGNLNTLIFTHEHDDHFCAEDVKEAWLRNPELRIYAGENAIAALEQCGITKKNLVRVEHEEQADIGEFHIQFIETLHEGTRYAHVQNLTLLIGVGEQKLIITGDAAPEETLFQRLAEWSYTVDGIMLPFPYIGLKSTRKLLEQYLDVNKIFVLHQPRKEADEQKWVERAKRVCQEATDTLPLPFFPEKIGKWYFI